MHVPYENSGAEPSGHKSGKIDTLIIRTTHPAGSNTLIIVEAASAGTLGPLVTAFCTELGKRLGGTAADWAARVFFGRRTDDPGKTVLMVEEDYAATVIEVDENLSDEARLALLDLDVGSDALRGHRLRWYAQAEAWQPIDMVTELERPGLLPKVFPRK